MTAAVLQFWVRPGRAAATCGWQGRGGAWCRHDAAGWLPSCGHPCSAADYCSPHWGPRQSLCVSGLLAIRPPPPRCSAAVLQCLASVCCHKTAHWSLVCQGVTSISTILQALLLCRIFLKFCFLKCPQADLILPLYSQLKMPGQAIYPSPPASRHCSAVHFSVSSAVRLSAGRCCCCDVEVLMLLLSRA